MMLFFADTTDIAIGAGGSAAVFTGIAVLIAALYKGLPQVRRFLDGGYKAKTQATRDALTMERETFQYLMEQLQRHATSQQGVIEANYECIERLQKEQEKLHAEHRDVRHQNAELRTRVESLEKENRQQAVELRELRELVASRLK